MDIPRSSDGAQGLHSHPGSPHGAHDGTAPAAARSPNGGEPGGSALSSPKLGVKGRPAKQRVRHRKVRAGETIFKGHPSYQIMMNLKLGIAYSSGRSGARQTGPLQSKDFRTVFTRTFPPEGSTTTPAHSTRIFQYKDHAPLAFRHLREHFGVSEQDYVVSICGENSLRELGTPGKSGAVFYLTEDYRYIIKTVSKKESKFLRRMLPNYYAHVMSCDSTLLPHFYGLIRITTQLGRNIRMVVMNNLMPEEAVIHEKFDLKGSTLGRYATEAERADPNCTLKDLDWRHKLALPPSTLQLLSAQVESDAGFLQQLRIMDYSMLAMLHYPARVDDEWDGLPSPDFEPNTPIDEEPEPLRLPPTLPPSALPPWDAPATSGTGLFGSGRFGSDGGEGGGAAAGQPSPRRPPPQPGALEYVAAVRQQMDADGDGVISVEEALAHAKRLGGISISAAALAGGVLHRRGPSTGGTTPRLVMSNSEPAKGTRAPSSSVSYGGAESDSEDESEVAAEMRLPNVTSTELSVAYERSQARARDGRRGPAAAVRLDDGLPGRLENGEEVVFFCGVIDILQQYGVRKQMEHRYKAIRYARDRSGISVTDPKTYAARFLDFVGNLFEVQGTEREPTEREPSILEDDVEQGEGCSPRGALPGGGLLYRGLTSGSLNV